MNKSEPLCQETVWLPGPPETEFGGPHYCGLPAVDKYLVHNRYEKYLCQAHADSLGSYATHLED